MGVTLRIGWRFYRQVMKTVRLGWEAWGLPQDICDTIEGLYGSWIDGASLDYARKLYDRICLLRLVICNWADRGLSSRQVYRLLAARLKERDAFWEVLEFGRRDPNLLGQAALAVLLEKKKEVPMREPMRREFVQSEQAKCRECGRVFWMISKLAQSEDFAPALHSGSKMKSHDLCGEPLFDFLDRVRYTVVTNATIKGDECPKIAKARKGSGFSRVKPVKRY